MTIKRVIPVEDLGVLFEDMVAKVSAITPAKWVNVYGVPRGGIPVAMALVPRLHGARLVTDLTKADVIVDDIYDSGATAAKFAKWASHLPFVALVDKREEAWKGQWIVFPWEVGLGGVDMSGDDIVLRLLEFIGEDPHREGLRDTPRRVLKAWEEWAQGYRGDPASLLKTFEDGAEHCGDELVVVHNIPVVSKCEHHLADIHGTAHVGYIPDGKIVGLSKMARVVDLFARRLQVQERMTNQIADAINGTLSPKGVGVIIRASHACMSTRGVNIQGSVTTTSAMRGVLLTKPEARAEFLHLCDSAER